MCACVVELVRARARVHTRMRARVCWMKVMFKIYLDELSKQGNAGWNR